VRGFPRIFKRKLYRDGVPALEVYRGAPIQVLFVFREPNFKNKPNSTLSDP